ncbi:MAG: hypothetical protein L6R41_004277 [Letrouitia leprolyta]|nr:MAG: hypothetical protein L6R41_004277 [Letrouitia leprolyta]
MPRTFDSSDNTSNSSDDGWQWNPYKVLNLYPERADFFCVGRSVSKGKARCRKRINTQEIWAACNILDRLAVEGPEDPNFQRRLQVLAQSTLCQDWHQDQVWQIVQDWRVVAQEWLDEKEELRKLQKQAKAYQKKLRKLEARIDDRNRKLKKSKSAYQRESRSRQVLEVRLAEMTETLDAKCQEYQDLQSKNVKSQESGAEMETKWQLAIKMVEVAERRLATSTEEAEIYAKDLQDIIERGAKEIQDLQKEIEEAHSMAEKDSGDKWEARDLERIQQEQEIEVLRKGLNGKEESLKIAKEQLQEEIMQRILETDEAIEERKGLEDQLRRLNSKAEEDARRAISTEEQLRNCITIMEDEAQLKHEENYNLMSELDILRAEHSKSAQELKQLQGALAAKIDQMRTDANNAHDREEALHKKVEQLQLDYETALAEAKAEGQNLRAEASTLRTDLSEANQALDELTIEAKQLYAQLDTARDESMKARNDHRKEADHLESTLVAEQKKSEGLATNLEYIYREKQTVELEVEEVRVSK